MVTSNKSQTCPTSIVIGARNVHHEQVISVHAPAGVMGGLLRRMRA
jgi:hypothetical protein